MRYARVQAKARAELGVAEGPDEAGRKAKVSVAKIISRYQEDEYPDKKGVARKAGKHRDEEEARCEVLLEYFNGDAPAEGLDQDALDEYHKWCRGKVKKGHVKKDGSRSKPKGDGSRTVDLELNTLNNAYRWAVRKKLIKVNPIASRARYHPATAAKHCREYAPTDTDELHEVAGTLMSSRRSEVLGWQLLYEAMTGLRSEEAVQLRLNARPNEAGGLTPDGGSVCVRRADKSRNQRFIGESDEAQLPQAKGKGSLKERRPGQFCLRFEAARDVNGLIYAVTYKVFRHLRGNIFGLTAHAARDRAFVSVYHSLPPGLSLEQAQAIAAEHF